MNSKPQSIPPKSIIKLKKCDGISYWKKKVGKKCRVGYYSKQDGLNIVWVVDQYGDYVETVEMSDLLDWFDVILISNLDDGYFGDNSQPIGPITDSSQDWNWT